MGYAATPELEQARRSSISTNMRSRVQREGKVAGRFMWSEDQVRTLRDMWARSAPIKQIAHETGKSPKAVKSMRAYLGLPTRKGKGGDQNRTERLNLYLTPPQMEGVRRQAQYHRRSVNSYLEMLLRRDGAL